jgi:nuclease S1
MKHRALSIVAAAFALFLMPSAAMAWGESGHYTVCEIAYINLTPTAKAEVDRLIQAGGGYPSFTQSCTFPDKPRQRASEHFANYARSVKRVDGAGCPGGRPCVITAIANDLAVLRSATASDGDKSASLKFIGHWLGDIHQPLHISFADDQGGNQIDESGPCDFGLHAIWDTCIVERRVFGPGTDRYARAQAAAARLNGTITNAQRTLWRRLQPWQWAAESYQITLRPQTGYCIRKTAACWYSPTKQTYANGDPKRVQVVDNAYLDWAKPIVEGRLMRGGIRLAHELNKSFDPAYRG